MFETSATTALVLTGLRCGFVKKLNLDLQGKEGLPLSGRG